MSNYIKQVIISGDTVQALSQEHLGDAGRWVELVLLNNLDYPFIVDSFRDSNTPPNVLAIGDTILIPVDDPNQLDSTNQVELREVYERMLGEDISIFDSNMSISLSEDFGGEFQSDTKGDLKTVRGVQNLKQAIMIRFCVPLGALLYHPSFGTRLYELMGTKASYGNIQKIKIEIERVIRGDKRVSDIVIDSFTLLDGVINASVSITAIGIEEIINMSFSLDKMGVIEWD